jgi:hypothetical protein
MGQVGVNENGKIRGITYARAHLKFARDQPGSLGNGFISTAESF